MVFRDSRVAGIEGFSLLNIINIPIFGQFRSDNDHICKNMSLPGPSSGGKKKSIVTRERPAERDTVDVNSVRVLLEGGVREKRINLFVLGKPIFPA